MTPLRILLTRLPLLLAGTFSSVHAAPGQAHEHGAARLDIAVETTRITVQLDSPLDNLLGFEHAPRNAAERQRVDALVTRLKDAERLLRIDPAGGCVLASVQLQAPAVGVETGVPTTTAAQAQEGHGDLQAEFTFDCPRARQARHIDLEALWTAFSGLQRLDTQLATDQGQQARQTLRRPRARLNLPH